MSPELHPGYYIMCGKCNSCWMLWCFGGWVVVRVRWCFFWANLQPGYMDMWDKDSADALEVYQEQGWPWIGDSWAPDTVFRPAITSTASPSQQHHSLGTLSVLVFQHYTQGPCHIFKKVVMTNYTRNMCTWWSTCTYFPISCVHFSHYIVSSFMLQGTFNSSNVLLSNLAYTSSFCNRDITSLHLLLLHFSSAYTSPFQDIIKIHWQQLVLKTV